MKILLHHAYALPVVYAGRLDVRYSSSQCGDCASYSGFSLTVYGPAGPNPLNVTAATRHEVAEGRNPSHPGLTSLSAG